MPAPVVNVTRAGAGTMGTQVASQRAFHGKRAPVDGVIPPSGTDAAVFERVMTLAARS